MKASYEVHEEDTKSHKELIINTLWDTSSIKRKL